MNEQQVDRLSEQDRFKYSSRFVRLMSSLAIAITCVLVVEFPQAVYAQQTASDWLIDSQPYRAYFEPAPADANDAKRFQLGNGLVTRTFLLDQQQGFGATIRLENLSSGQSLLRAVRPEAIVEIDGKRYEVGGLTGQPNHAFLKPDWLPQMKPTPGALVFCGHRIGTPEQRFKWNRVRHHAADASWPASGISLTLEFKPPDHDRFRVQIHYEVYDKLPVICKWLTIENRSDQTLTVDRFASEILAVVERDSRVESRVGVALPPPNSIHVETDFAFGGFTYENANRHVVHWKSDPEYTTQVNYKKETPCLLVVEPTYGPDQTILADETFTSFRTFELLHDSSDRERRSLSLRKMYRVIAPWVTENPLMHHMRVADPEAVKRAIDEAAEVGFEMIILSFGSGFNIEDDSLENLNRWKAVADYAKQKKIEIGGYSLLSSRRIGNGNDIKSPKGKSPTHGNCPALTSDWGIEYYRKLREFFEVTGFAVLEHDGPYPGDVDVTARLPWQKGESDSRWAQAKIANNFYRWCREKGIFVNAPDYYFLNGTNKCGMGYREVNWSLPRSMQLIHTRQNIFDGTWYKAPSMGWMFVPLSEYHGGGKAATIEPLEDHLQHYEQMIQSNLGFGVQACFRGPRLFDSEKTKQMLKRNVDWFKKYRELLESDMIHGRRADGWRLDWMLHANPHLKQQGMLVVHNPTEKPLTELIKVNLYYTGATDWVTVSERDRTDQTYKLNRDFTIDLSVTVDANSMNWFVLKKVKDDSAIREPTGKKIHQK
ncbi:MAG: alpha-galactosidase [Planctomycetota bacterium]